MNQALLRLILLRYLMVVLLVSTTSPILLAKDAPTVTIGERTNGLRLYTSKTLLTSTLQLRMKTQIESTAERKRKRHHINMPRIRLRKHAKKYSAHVDPRLKTPRVQWNKFYGSKAWHNLRDSKLLDQPLCERCLEKGKITPATCVHHRCVYGSCPSDEERWYWFLNYKNLVSLCDGCHKYIHATNDLGWIYYYPFTCEEYVNGDE